MKREMKRNMKKADGKRLHTRIETLMTNSVRSCSNARDTSNLTILRVQTLQKRDNVYYDLKINLVNTQAILLR